MQRWRAFRAGEHALADHLQSDSPAALYAEGGPSSLAGGVMATMLCIAVENLFAGLVEDVVGATCLVTSPSPLLYWMARNGNTAGMSSPDI